MHRTAAHHRWTFCFWWAVLGAAPALAQPKAPDHAAPQAAAPAAASAAPAAATSAVEMSVGEVRRIDKSAGKLTLKHGEIKHLDMPPMTMVFQVQDPALLDKVKPGDPVRFRAEKAASGYVVTAIELAR
ncbi:MAG: copper-binding protein [Betaproteobacteria bacterium]